MIPSVALGVPLINAIYETDPNLGSYTLPLLIWHPMQLVIGSFLAPRLLAFVQREKERLGIKDDDDDDDDGGKDDVKEEINDGNQFVEQPTAIDMPAEPTERV